MNSCVHIYCGDGKGKTTAAIGLAVRSAGNGQKVLIARFLKTDCSGEVAALKQIPQIIVMPCEKSFGFFSHMTSEQKSEAAAYYSELLDKTWRKAASEQVDMLVLDEIMAVCNFGLVDEAVVRNLILNRRDNMEVILTGRNPSEGMVELADYISEIRKKRHPYDKGLRARKGIEF